MNGRKPRILIVDDEPDTCENLSDILTDLEYEADTASDGLAALKLVKENAYDIALLDLKMPGMDGVELYRRIREISAGTVAIIVTAYASSDTARSALTAGAWRILPKPINIRDLLGLVDQALESPLVLIVDDDRDLCENLWDLFREHGFRVHLAHDVPDAERSLNQHQFNVLVVDMRLPTGDGHEVLKTLRSANNHTRTIVITGRNAEMEDKVNRALQDGANAVCYKPFDVRQLLSTVEQFCHTKSQ